MPKQPWKHAVSQLTCQLEAIGNKRFARGRESCMKQVVKSLGITSPQIRAILKQLALDFNMASTWTGTDFLSAANAMLESPYVECKSAGAYLLNTAATARKIAIEVSNLEVLSLMIDRHVNNWSTCDSICTGIATRLIAVDPATYIDKIAQWRFSKHLWKKRISCVAFLQAARRGKHLSVAVQVCRECLSDQRRFMQLGLGWLLREVSTKDQQQVIQLIHQHYDSFTREGLRSAIEKMPNDIRLQLLHYDKKRKSSMVSSPERKKGAQVKQEHLRDRKKKIRE